jgi:hypothetical protein
MKSMSMPTSQERVSAYTMEGLATMWRQDSDEDETEAIQAIHIGTETDRPVVMQISLALDDGQAPGSLFAYNIWNGAVRSIQWQPS